MVPGQHPVKAVGREEEGREGGGVEGCSSGENMRRSSERRLRLTGD